MYKKETINKTAPKLIITIVLEIVLWCAISYRNNLRTIGNILIVLYALSSIVYIVLKALTPGTIGRNTGLLIVEITGTCSILGFMSFCLAFVWKVKIKRSPK